MAFIHPSLDNFLEKLYQLSHDDQPLWGSMSAQRMVEHLSDTIDLSLGKRSEFKIEVPEDKMEKAQAFILSEHPMPKNFKAGHAKEDTPERNKDLKEAIDEFESKWIEFVTFYEKNPGKKILHPNFGNLGFDLWLPLHAKHCTHHFEQFNLM